MRARQLVLPARQSKLHPEIEFSIHRASTLFWKSDVRPVFPEAPAPPPRAPGGQGVDPDAPGCFVVVTFQAARGVMVDANELEPTTSAITCPLITGAADTLGTSASGVSPQAVEGACAKAKDGVAITVGGDDDDGTKIRVVAGNTTSSTGGCCMITSNTATKEFKDLSRDKFYDFMRDFQAAVHRATTPSDANEGTAGSETTLETSAKENSPMGTPAASTATPSAAPLAPASPEQIPPTSAAVWVDWTDPANGMPALGRCGPSVYSEVDAIEQLLSTPIVTVGFATGLCRLLSHPVHGLDVYPASGFVAGISTAALVKALEGI